MKSRDLEKENKCVRLLYEKYLAKARNRITHAAVPLPLTELAEDYGFYRYLLAKQRRLYGRYDSACIEYFDYVLADIPGTLQLVMLLVFASAMVVISLLAPPNAIKIIFLTSFAICILMAASLILAKIMVRRRDLTEAAECQVLCEMLEQQGVCPDEDGKEGATLTQGSDTSEGKDA